MLLRVHWCLRTTRGCLLVLTSDRSPPTAWYSQEEEIELSALTLLPNVPYKMTSSTVQKCQEHFCANCIYVNSLQLKEIIS